MDKQVIAQKLESLRKCVARIETKSPQNAETLNQDMDLQDIIALNLSRAVQLSVDIGAHIIAELDSEAPETMGKTFDTLAQAGVIAETTALNLKKAVGFRNIAVHNYERINWLIVHAITQKNLADFQAYTKQIHDYLEKH